MECFNLNAAVMKAAALAHRSGHVCAIAFARTGGSSNGDSSGAKIHKGDVRDGLERCEKRVMKATELVEMPRSESDQAGALERPSAMREMTTRNVLQLFGTKNS